MLKTNEWNQDMKKKIYHHQNKNYNDWNRQVAEDCPHYLPLLDIRKYCWEKSNVLRSYQKIMVFQGDLDG